MAKRSVTVTCERCGVRHRYEFVPFSVALRDATVQVDRIIKSRPLCTRCDKWMEAHVPY